MSHDKHDHEQDSPDHSAHNNLHHNSITIYSEYIKEKLEWLYTPFSEKSFYEKLLTSIFPIHHPHEYDITKIDESNQSQQVNRMVVAMEKLVALNHHAFTKKERQILTPTRKGLVQKAYIFSLSSISALWILHCVSTRNFNPRYIGAFFAFSLVSNAILKPLPHYLKEQIRLFKARRLAIQFYTLKKNNFDEFRMILDPKTPLEILAHHNL